MEINQSTFVMVNCNDYNCQAIIVLADVKFYDIFFDIFFEIWGEKVCC